MFNVQILSYTRQVSSMIHSARSIVTPVMNIVLCCFVFLDLKSGDGRTTCAKTMIHTGRDFGLAEWIKNISCIIIIYRLKKKIRCTASNCNFCGLNLNLSLLFLKFAKSVKSVNANFQKSMNLIK